MRFLAILLLLVPLQDEEKEPTAFDKLDSDDDAERKAAYEELSKSEDKSVTSRLRMRLRSLRTKWMKTAKDARTEAVEKLIKDRDDDDLASKRREALGLLAKGDTKKMEPIVKAMWTEYYFDREKADAGSDPAKKRVLEYHAWAQAMGSDKKVDQAAKIADSFRKVDEKQIFERMPEESRGVMKANAAAYKRIEPWEYEVILMTNMYRVMMGKKPLKINQRLCAACRDHSKDMKEKNFFSHTSPVRGKKTFMHRAKRFGTKARAENIAKARDPEGAFWGWFLSLGHHKNMMRDWTQIGVGYYEGHWTENF